MTVVTMIQGQVPKRKKSVGGFFRAREKGKLFWEA